MSLVEPSQPRYGLNIGVPQVKALAAIVYVYGGST